jgi:ATP-dependent helicase/nuclease subunit A
VIVQGIIDLVVVRDDGVYLIDYKTNRGMTAEELSKTYSLQLKLYSHAFKEATGIEITKKFLYSFKLGRLINVD